MNFNNQQNNSPEYKKNLNIKFDKIQLARTNIISIDNQAGTLYYKKFCIICLSEFTAQRKDTLTCCPACSRNMRYCFKTGQPLPMDVFKHKSKIENKNKTKI